MQKNNINMKDSRLIVIYLKFLIASFIMCGISLTIVTFINVYFSGPNSGSLLNGYLGISKVLLYLIFQLGLTFLFKFHKSIIRLFVALVVLVFFSLLPYYQN
jgi:hypothetical protein